jgi:replication-associated recombination protein RarA
MTYRVRKTKLGYELPEVTSALQKSIRRGEVEHAMWWAQELLRSSYGAYLWRRLLVIASEDVGPAANDMVVVVRALRENAIVLARRKNLRGEDWEAQSLQALHAVVALCLAPKSRLVPEADFVLRHRADSGERLEIPDWALDHHTPAGRRRGLRKGTAASARFWKKEGRTIRPDAELLDNVWRDRFDEILDRERGLDLELPLDEPGEPDP